MSGPPPPPRVAKPMIPGKPKPRKISKRLPAPPIGKKKPRNKRRSVPTFTTSNKWGGWFLKRKKRPEIFSRAWKWQKRYVRLNWHNTIKCWAITYFDNKEEFKEHGLISISNIIAIRNPSTSSGVEQSNLKKGAFDLVALEDGNERVYVFQPDDRFATELFGILKQMLKSKNKDEEHKSSSSAKSFTGPVSNDDFDKMMEAMAIPAQARIAMRMQSNDLKQKVYQQWLVCFI